MFQIIATSIIIPYSTSTSSVDQTYGGFIECILNCIGNFMHSVSIILGRHSREAIIIHWTKAQFYQIQYTLLNKNIPLLHPYYCRDQILYWTSCDNHGSICPFGKFQAVIQFWIIYKYYRLFRLSIIFNVDLNNIVRISVVFILGLKRKFKRSNC